MLTSEPRWRVYGYSQTFNFFNFSGGFKVFIHVQKKDWDFPRGPVVKNPPSNAGDMSSIPGRGTKIPHATAQLSPCATTTELSRLNERAGVLQTTEPTRPGACAPQLEKRKNRQATTREQPEQTARRNEKDPACLNKDPMCRN